MNRARGFFSGPATGGRTLIRLRARPCASAAAAFAIAAIVMLSGCSSSVPVNPNDPGVPQSVAGADQRVPSAATSPLNQKRLRELWDKRMANANQPVDYPIGPGDVIEVSVPAMEELRDRTVRVGGTGDIELPLLGTIRAAGLTEAQLTDKIDQALTKYMYDPQAQVFIREYRSRQVAVVGSVRSPGLITLQRSDETILDAITQAGGMTAEAADEIVILPEAAQAPERLQRVAESYMETADPKKQIVKAREPDPPANAPPAPTVQSLSSPTLADVEANISNGPAVVIPLKNTALTGNPNYINLPAQPGDVIVVPGGGNVMVTGWVYRPGFFQVGSGLTVLGAVGSAGGAMYAADASSATLIRSNSTGNKVAIPVNLDRIAKGEDPDIPVRANDVIDVPYSSLKIGPYVVYSILSKMTAPLPAY